MLYEMGEVSFHLLQQMVFRLMLWSEPQILHQRNVVLSALNQSYHRFVVLP